MDERLAAEQRLRLTGDLAAADHRVCHRAAIAAGGMAALSGQTPMGWLTPEPLPVRAIWGHEGAIIDAVVVSEHLVSLGEDGWLRVWTPDGVCRTSVAMQGRGLLVTPDGVGCLCGDALIRLDLDGTETARLTGLPEGAVAARGEGYIALSGDAVLLLDASGATLQACLLYTSDAADE